MRGDLADDLEAMVAGHYGPQANKIREAAAALRAVRDAPVVEVTECNQVAGASDFDFGDLYAAFQKFKPGTFVRIVPAGDGDE